MTDVYPSRVDTTFSGTTPHNLGREGPRSTFPDTMVTW
jgi:hypothetical protein